jgi:Cys-tRNA(Pro)/Cys-tRNA(Cys) deacylase
MKTNAVRILESKRINYRAVPYAVDETDLSAETVAAKVGLPCAQVFKTLCVRGDKRGVLFAVIAGDAELDTKALAKVTGDKSIEPVALKEVQPLTGYIRGGVTALGAKKEYPVFVDEAALLFDVISISAGARGLQIFLAPSDYVAVTKATTGVFSRPKAAF